MADLILQFEADLRARQLSDDVVRRYRGVLLDLRAFVGQTGNDDLAASGRREIEAYLRERGV